MGRLGKRLDGVREKVEVSSMRDRESRRVISRRLKMMWACLGSLAMLVFILATTRHWRRNDHATGDQSVHSADWADTPEKGVGQEDWQPERERQQDDKDWKPGARTRPRLEDLMDVDATLRLFDEL